MTPSLSIIIASHNEDPVDLNRTLATISHTPGAGSIEVVVVDDASAMPVVINQRFAPTINLLRNNQRMGVGPSRTRGVHAASSDIIFICDAHMVFETLFPTNWLQAIVHRLTGNPKLVLCGQCRGLNNSLQPAGTYNGAKMVIHDPAQEPRWRIMACRWRDDLPGKDDYHLSGMMGALYAMHKAWFMHIGGLGILKEFGGDEELMSIRTIRCGGEIRICKNLSVGHKFRNGSPPYRIIVEHCLYNAMVVAETCCPPNVAQELITHLGDSPQVATARKLVLGRSPKVDIERDDMQKRYTLSWDEYLIRLHEIDG